MASFIKELELLLRIMVREYSLVELPVLSVMQQPDSHSLIISSVFAQWALYVPLRLGTIEAHQRIRLWPVGSLGPGRFPYSFQMIPRGLLVAWTTGNLPTTLLLINQSSCTGENVDIKWPGMTGTPTWDPLVLGQTCWPLDHRSPQLITQNPHHQSRCIARADTEANSIVSSSTLENWSRRHRLVISPCPGLN
jgi:hypothetical protein